MRVEPKPLQRWTALLQGARVLAAPLLVFLGGELATIYSDHTAGRAWFLLGVAGAALFALELLVRKRFLPGAAVAASGGLASALLKYLFAGTF